MSKSVHLCPKRLEIKCALKRMIAFLWIRSHEAEALKIRMAHQNLAPLRVFTKIYSGY